MTQKALELERNYAFGLTSQGVAYAEQGRMQEAIGNLQKAAQLDRSPTILALGAHVHAVAGQKAEARRLDPGGRGRIQAPLFLPVRNRHRVCEPWRSRYRLSVVPQRHRGSRRLHGVVGGRTLDAAVPLGSPLCAAAARNRAVPSAIRLRLPSVPAGPRQLRKSAVCNALQTSGRNSSAFARMCTLDSCASPRALAGIDEEDRRTRPRSG